MAFSRTNLMAAVAGTLSVAVLAGCPQSPSNVGPSTTPTSTEPTTAPTGEPTATASKSPLESTTVRGNVYDDQGTPVSSAKLRIESLNPSNPFDSTVDVVSGAYVANGVPAGVQVRLTVQKDGWTPRSQVTTLLPLASSQSQIVNFGTVAGNGDDGAGGLTAAYTNSTDAGKAYYISNNPEISSIEPADKATGVSADTVSVKITLSEVLDQTNRNNLANALFVTNDPTLANVNTTGPVAMKDGAGNALAAPIALPNVAASALVQKGVTFAKDQTAPATVTWDAEGKVATLTFSSPVVTTTDSQGIRYFVGLDNDARAGVQADAKAGAKDIVIADSEGNKLNFANAFRVGETNRSYTYYNVASDNTAPTLASATIDKVNGSHRLALTFSEPIAAFASTAAAPFSFSQIPGGIAAANLHIVFDKTVADISTSDDDLKNVTPTPITKWSDITSGGANVDAVLSLTPGGANAAGTFTAAVSDTNAKVLYITSGTAPDLLPTTIGAFKVYINGLKDPAGNAMTSSTVSGTF